MKTIKGGAEGGTFLSLVTNLGTLFPHKSTLTPKYFKSRQKAYGRKLRTFSKFN